MNKNSDHITHELIFTTETLLKILDAIDSKNTIHETEEFNRLNKLYELTVKSFQELSTDISTEAADYISQTLPGDLRAGLDYIEANYRDVLRPKVITLLSHLNDSLSDTSSPADTDNISESIGEIVSDFIQQTNIKEDNLPKSLDDIKRGPQKDVVFRVVFESPSYKLSINNLVVRQLGSNSSYSDIFEKAINNPGKPVNSISTMSKYISDLKKIPDDLKSLIFPVKGKGKFAIVPEITKEMLDGKNLDSKKLKEELLILNKKK